MLDSASRRANKVGCRDSGGLAIAPSRRESLSLELLHTYLSPCPSQVEYLSQPPLATVVWGSQDTRPSWPTAMRLRYSPAGPPPLRNESGWILYRCPYPLKGPLIQMRPRALPLPPSARTSGSALYVPSSGSSVSRAVFFFLSLCTVSTRSNKLYSGHWPRTLPQMMWACLSS